MKINLVKHESGYYITNPAALKQWQDSHRVATGESERFKALVKVKKSKCVATEAGRFSDVELIEPDEGPSHHWIVTEIYREADGSIYFQTFRGQPYEIGKTILGNCWFAREVIPVEFIRSPARLALESLA